MNSEGPGWEQDDGMLWVVHVLGSPERSLKPVGYVDFLENIVHMGANGVMADAEFF